MKIAGFNFKKISIEKLDEGAQNVKINTKIDISNIKTLKAEFVNTKDELLQIDFSYVIDYEPNFAKIEINGSVIIAVIQKNAREIVKQWEDKKMPDELRVDLFNIILRKSNIKALELEDELNLPLHIPFPSLKPEQKSEK